MENLTQFEQELESILPPDEADLEPNIVEDVEEDYLGDTISTFEDYKSDYEDDDDYGENLVEMIEADTFDESFAEGRRRERANQKRSIENKRRSVINHKNIVRVNRDVHRNKKRITRNSRSISRHTKWSRKMAAKNTLAHKRSKIDINRIRRAVRTVGSRAGKNSELLELMGLMAIPKLIGGVVSNQINELVVVEDVVTTDENGVAIVTKVEKTLEVVDQQNDLLSSLAPSIPDLTALVGRYTKANKMVLVGGAVLLTALFGNKAIQRSSR